MAKFTPWEVERQWLIHPSIYEQVPEDDRPDVMCDAVREVVDLDAIAAPYRDDLSYADHYPAMMTALLYYAWSQGILSCRAIARSCERSVDVMALTAMHAPDFEEVRAFRERHAEALVAGLVRVLRVARRVGLPWAPGEGEDDDEATAMSFGRVDEALEAVAANWLATARRLDAEEDARLGAARDAPLPKWVPDQGKRRRKLREAREAIEREERARVEAQRLLAEDPDEDEGADPEDGDESTRVAAAMSDDAPRVQPAPAPEPENPLARRRRGRRPPSRISSRPHVAPSEDPAPRSERHRSRPGPDHPHLHRPEPAPRARAPSSERPPQAGRAHVRRRPGDREPPPPRRARRRAASDVILQNLSADTRLILMETIIGTAMADGSVAGIEQRRIDKLVRTLRLDPRERQQVYATLRDGSIPPLPTAAELPDYEVRRHVFEQAAIMALVDGAVDRAEHRYLKALADALELSIGDAKQALRRANQATGG